MDVKNKQRPKKRKTRRNLDELRKRSQSEVKSNVAPLIKSSLKLKNIQKYQITSNRLTLPFFNKTITSKIITRVPLAKIDTKDEVYKARNNEAVRNILSTSNKFQMSDEIGTSRITTTGQQKNNMKIGKKYKNSKKNVSETKVCESVESQSISLFSPLEQVEGSSFEKTSNNFNYTNRLSHSFSSSSEQESNHCLYKEFMKELPGYFREHFPTITLGKGNVENYFQDQCFGNECQENEGTALKCIAKKPRVITPENRRESIIENPMDYIQTGCSWAQSMQQKQSILLSSSSSSSVSHSASNSTDIFLNSPEYQYFPHKLNQ